MTAPMEPFDICGPLPTGTTVLEASAGTGKTYAVAALVTRYVAEGVAQLDDLLVITFGRAASQELRDRVRGHLTRAEQALATPESADRSERLIDHLLTGSAEEISQRRKRILAALASFDAATIATTHARRRGRHRRPCRARRRPERAGRRDRRRPLSRPLRKRELAAALRPRQGGQARSRRRRRSAREPDTGEHR
jgi:hypothetical protein